MFPRISVDRIMEGISVLVDQKRGSIGQIKVVIDYSGSNSSDRVFSIIISHTYFLIRKSGESKLWIPLLRSQ
jgi:hypothetical protein